ncbi:hypothetical protein D3C78_1275810 [compost metagenome]
MEPCTKLTPIADITSTRRFQNGGCFLSSSLRRCSGVLCIFDSGRHHFSPNSTSAATAKPAMGESTRDMPMSIAFCQLTPSPSGISLISALARPTPRIEPIKVWELEAGIPKYQVPRFQAMAAASKEKTMANP